MAVVILPAKKSFLGDMMEGAQTMLPYVMQEKAAQKSLDAQSALAKLTRDQQQQQFDASMEQRKVEHSDELDWKEKTFKADQAVRDLNAEVARNSLKMSDFNLAQAQYNLAAGPIIAMAKFKPEMKDQLNAALRAKKREVFGKTITVSDDEDLIGNPEITANEAKTQVFNLYKEGRYNEADYLASSYEQARIIPKDTLKQFKETYDYETSQMEKRGAIQTQVEMDRQKKLAPGRIDENKQNYRNNQQAQLDFTEGGKSNPADMHKMWLEFNKKKAAGTQMTVEDIAKLSPGAQFVAVQAGAGRTVVDFANEAEFIYYLQNGRLPGKSPAIGSARDAVGGNSSLKPDARNTKRYSILRAVPK